MIALTLLKPRQRAAPVIFLWLGVCFVVTTISGILAEHRVVLSDHPAALLAIHVFAAPVLTAWVLRLHARREID